MKDIYFLRDLATVKTVSDPQRLRILEHLICQRATVQQIAGMLQDTPAKIHYHVKELEKYGLIQLVKTIEKKGILEKYYRAVAYNFYIDQALGKFFQENEAAALHTVTRDILSWRRHELLKVDIERVAKTMVSTCLAIQPGEVVYIQGSTLQSELAEAISLHIFRAGANPHLQIVSPFMKLQMLQEMPEKYLINSMDYLVDWLDKVDTMVMLEHVVDPLELKQADPKRVELLRQAWSKVRNKRTERGIKWAFVGYPTNNQAAAIGVNFVHFHDIFWYSMDIEYDRIGTLGRRIASVLDKGQEVVLSSDRGTCLKLSITDRSSMVEDGIISAEDLADGRPFINLPCGEVSIAPVETSAEGKMYCNFLYYNGQRISGVELKFAGGKLVGIQAAEKENLIREMLFSGNDDRNRIGELGIGLNPKILEPLGYQVYDSKAFGRVHLSMGENRMFGGKNQSALNLPLVLEPVDVAIDGQQLIRAGQFVFK
ncbi:MAG: hypothetical protein APF76_13535 [Desulfitibacter sp. BRH_c19]|nr:MAG: hypothetical protein APF76_13535 [Desulfitibacter sp. BRH_c19]